MTNKEYLEEQNKQNKDNQAAMNAELKPENNTVEQTQNYLQSLLQNKPSDFNSKYMPQIESLYDKVMNRDKFSYDVNADPLYQQYKNQYAQMGQLAMQDTIGNAAALTGGYGNSWATTAGNQAYQGYLQQLNNKVPELYQQAYAQYAQEGEDLQNQLALAAGMYEDEYQKHMDDLGYMQQMHQTAYNQAMSMLQAGMTPSPELLAQAGISEADAKAFLQKKNSGGGGSGNSLSKQKEAYAFAMQMIENGMTPSPELIAQAGIKTDEAGAYINAMQNYYGMGGTQETGTVGTQETGTGKPPASATDADAITGAAPPPIVNNNNSQGFSMDNLTPEMAEEAVQIMNKIFGIK